MLEGARRLLGTLLVWAGTRLLRDDVELSTPTEPVVRDLGGVGLTAHAEAMRSYAPDARPPEPKEVPLVGSLEAQGQGRRR